MKICRVGHNIGLQGFHFHWRCLSISWHDEWGAQGERKHTWEILPPCPVRQHLRDYHSPWKVIVSMSWGWTLQKSFKYAHMCIYSKFGLSMSPRLLQCLLQRSFWAEPLHVGQWDCISRSCQRGDGKYVPRKPTTLNSLWAKSLG